MFKCDILEERKQRQLDNDKAVEKLLRANLSIHHLKKSKFVNDKAVDRLLEEGIFLTNLDDNTIKIAAKYLSVSTTRQGALDEAKIINGVNSALVNMTFKKPEKEKRIVGLDKSIDAFLQNHNGEIIGHGFCKVMNGDGSTQKYELSEALQFLNHASKQDDGLLRVCLVDGNYNDKWRKKAEQYLLDDVWLCDHQQLQLKLQERYGVELKEIDNVINNKNPIEELMYADAT